MTKTAFALLLATHSATVAARAPTPHETRVLAEIVSLWGWEKYWLGSFPGMPRFQHGTTDLIYLIEHRDGLLVCSEKLESASVYMRNQGGALRELDSADLPEGGTLLQRCQRTELGKKSTIAGVDPKDIRAAAAIIESVFRSAPTQSRVPPTGPRQKTVEERARDEQRVIAWEEVRVTWPALPDVKALDLAQPGSEALVLMIRGRMDSDRRGACRSSATVPRYGQADPSVFVLFKDADCSEWILEMERVNGVRWKAVSKYTSQSFLDSYRPKIQQLAWKRID